MKLFIVLLCYRISGINFLVLGIIDGGENILYWVVVEFLYDR